MVIFTGIIMTRASKLYYPYFSHGYYFFSCPTYIHSINLYEKVIRTAVM
jgi:hypothetical protein